MPIYEYRCNKCKKHHEIMQKITESPLTICPSCGGTIKKIISSTSFVLKGSGWYATDYADKTRKEAKESTGKKESAKTDASADTKTDKAADKKD
jgi:putative FmdB family regulatory protein